MELNLQGKVAIVTGASTPTGFGRAIALTLAREGCDVVVNGRNLEGAQRTATEVRALGRQALAIKTDVSNSAEVTEMVKTTLEKFGKIDILVNNAGGVREDNAGRKSLIKPFAEYTDAEWNMVIDVNLKGVIICTKAVLNHMISRRSGKIINISSGAGKVGQANNTAYSAAKAGVMGFTKALACEVGVLGINVNSVSPGMALTTGVRDIPREFIEALKPTIPLGRLTEAQDIANMVAFLASDVASDIVGQVFSVDGGRVRI